MSLARMRRRTRAWGRRQLYSFFSSLGTLVGHRLGTVMTVLVLGIAMLLPTGLFVAVNNLRALDFQQEDWGTLTVFLEPGLEQPQAHAVADRIGRERAAEVVAVSPEQGMQEFRDASGFELAPELFEENPLPWVLQVRPVLAPGEDLERRSADLTAWLRSQEGVEAVQVDFKWLQRLAGLLAFGDAFVTVLGVLFSLAVVVVVANTIRLDVASRVEEIEVLHLVGASNGFVRQPFLYLGFWYGLLGALLALLLLWLAMAYLAVPLQHLLDAYGNTFSFHGLGVSGVLAVLFAGGLLGLLGSWLSVQRFLRRYRLDGLRSRH